MGGFLLFCCKGLLLSIKLGWLHVYNKKGDLLNPPTYVPGEECYVAKYANKDYFLYLTKFHTYPIHFKGFTKGGDKYVCSPQAYVLMSF